MKLFLCLALAFPTALFSQISRISEDHYGFYNPSSLSDKKIYLSSITNFNNLNYLDYFSTALIYKQRIKGFSIGFNSEFNNYGYYKSTSAEFQTSYGRRISRKLTINSGLGLRISKDNFIENNSWNPAYFGLNAGINLTSRKWLVGLSIVNLTQGNRMIDTIKLQVPVSFTFFGSYDFKLDSLGKYHLIPSLFFESNNLGFNYSMFNIKFNFSNHSTGFSYSRNQPSFIYQYNFGLGLSIGASIGKYISPFHNNFSDSWNTMLRLQYSKKRKLDCFQGIPNASW